MTASPNAPGTGVEVSVVVAAGVAAKKAVSVVAVEKSYGNSQTRVVLANKVPAAAAENVAWAMVIRARTAAAKIIEVGEGHSIRRLELTQSIKRLLQLRLCQSLWLSRHGPWQPQL